MILHILHVVARNVESAQQSAQLNGVHLQGQASLIQKPSGLVNLVPATRSLTQLPRKLCRALMTLGTFQKYP